jgi:hypothetical protein
MGTLERCALNHLMHTFLPQVCTPFQVANGQLISKITLKDLEPAMFVLNKV